MGNIGSQVDPTSVGPEHQAKRVKCFNLVRAFYGRNHH